MTAKGAFLAPSSTRKTPHIADYFQRWRERYRFTVAEVAERFGITSEAVEAVERGDAVDEVIAERINTILHYKAARALTRNAEHHY